MKPIFTAQVINFNFQITINYEVWNLQELKRNITGRDRCQIVIDFCHADAKVDKTKLILHLKILIYRT